MFSADAAPDDPSYARRDGPIAARRAALRLLLAVAGALLLLALTAPPALGQYFGRNKVQYDDFDFRVLETDHFDIHFYEAQSDRAIRDFARMSERWYERLARTFEYSFRERKPLLVYADQPDFQQTNAVSGFISQGTGGVTESLKDRVILPFGGTYGETDHVLGHELVHAFQFDIAASRQGGGATGFRQVPGWLIEGMPEYLSLGRIDAHTAMWMRDALLHDRFPTIRELSRGTEYFPYRFGHALWAYIAGEFGDAAVPALFRASGRGGFRKAVRQVLHVSQDTLSARWARATRAHFDPLLEGRTEPRDAGERILAPDIDAGEMNVSPSLSPDGDRVVFFSQKDLFTIDLFVADARTGEVEGKLASSAANPHFDALSFINSAGAWSPDGERFAFVTFASGDNEIAIADVESRDVERTLALEEIGAVYALDWSPDGSTIVFSGSRGGITDLYTVDVASGEVIRLTDDRFSELQPAFSPDGRTIAFATDRGTEGDLRRLSLPRMGIGFLDRGSGEIEVLRPFSGAKHINPKWAPDGESVYFISDREGFSDVYRMALSTGETWQVTRLATGVSGITGHSPALTVARSSGRVLFTVFERGNYIVYGRSAGEARGERVTPSGTEMAAAAVLPPAQVRGRALVSNYLADAGTGLPERDAYPVSDYDAGLRLDYVAQPRAGVAVDRFGTAIGGSVAAFFSDMLGNRNLAVAVTAQGEVEDIGGQAVYMNRKNRTNWGGGVARIPYRTGFSTFQDVEGKPDTFDRLFVIQRTTLNRANASVEYPFSRTNRLEWNAGVVRYGFDLDIIRTRFVGGVPTAQDEPSPGEVDLTEPDGFTLANASMAYVGDYSFFGFTSPVRGGRYRLEVEGNTGDLDFFSVLADYRRYLFLDPVTLAFRGMHFGRYGGDSEVGFEDGAVPTAARFALTPLYLGYQTFVRGYAVGSFDGSECSTVQGSSSRCPEFDRLLGSKIGVANLELRLPLVGTDQFGLLPLGFVPTEISLFLDGGVAWTDAESPELTFETGRTTERIPVFSAGTSVRLNVLGRFVTELYWAYAFQRPDESQLGFHLAPGW